MSAQEFGPKLNRTSADVIRFLLNNGEMITATMDLSDEQMELFALEIGAEAILMAKNGVKGVYDGDPKTDPDARFLPELTHLEAIEQGLRIMDTTALSLCMDNNLSIHVFELAEGNIRRVAAGERVGTVISSRKEAT